MADAEPPAKEDGAPGRAITPAPAATPAPKRSKKVEAPPALRRAELDPARARALRQRAEADGRRPLFTRQARYRYYRIGRDGVWRRPRGLQSKQRRHYGYRSTVVSIGFGSPRRVRGLVPSGFRPVVVRTSAEIERLDRTVEAAIIARTVGTRRRLALEETARLKGIRVLNPIVAPEEE